MAKKWNATLQKYVVKGWLEWEAGETERITRRVELLKQ